VDVAFSPRLRSRAAASDKGVAALIVRGCYWGHGLRELPEHLSYLLHGQVACPREADPNVR
jgi:hypothetical protein